MTPQNTYILAAAHRAAEAKAPDGEECTAFTGELVRVLREGIAPDTRTQEYLSLDAIHHKVHRALMRKFRPGPRFSDPGNIGRLPHFRNRALTVRQHGTTDLHATKGADANSALCYRPNGKGVGGINNMPGYCKKTLPKAGHIEAASNNPDYKNNWVCEQPVHLNAVCDKQHKVPDEQARENSNGDWNCYV